MRKKASKHLLKQKPIHIPIVKENCPPFYRIKTEGSEAKESKQRNQEKISQIKVVDIQRIVLNNDKRIKIKKINIKEYNVLPKPISEQKRKKVFLMNAVSINQGSTREKPFATKEGISHSAMETNENRPSKLVPLPEIRQTKLKVNIMKFKDGNKRLIQVNVPLNANSNGDKAFKQPIPFQKGFTLPKKQKIFLMKEKTQVITESNQHLTPAPYDFAYRENQNASVRKTMEDLHYINTNLTQRKGESIGFFAIYDGHNGLDVAKYCQSNLHKILVKQLHSTQFNIDVSLDNAFVGIDDELKDVPHSGISGTTATVVVLYKQTLFCANVGDSSCFIIQDDLCIEMTKDHKCIDQCEVNRIKQFEGIVYNMRVFGSLELTRALGDLDMKKYGVIPNPTILRYDISAKDRFAVIASDGVWTVLSKDDIFKHVAKRKDITAESLCEWIVSSAIRNYSKDNVSCIVIKL